MSFAEWEAAIAAGATLDELYKWDSGLYPKWFKIKVIAWHRAHSQVELHTSDAVARETERRSKK